MCCGVSHLLWGVLEHQQQGRAPCPAVINDLATGAVGAVEFPTRHSNLRGLTAYYKLLQPEGQTLGQRLVFRYVGRV